MPTYTISKQREDRIVSYLREYVALCKKHFMYVTGAIGAETALWDEDLTHDRKRFEEDLFGKISEMIYGSGMGGLFADDGNHIPKKIQLDRIWDRIREVK